MAVLSIREENGRRLVLNEKIEEELQLTIEFNDETTL